MVTHISTFLSYGEYMHGPIGFTLSPTFEHLFKAMACDVKYKDLPKLDILNGTGIKQPTHKCEWQLMHCTKNKKDSVMSGEKNKETLILNTCIGKDTETFTKPLHNIIKHIYIKKLTWMCSPMITGFSKSFIPKQTDK